MKPETGHEWSLGVHHKFGKTWNSNLNFFSRSTKDKIGWVMTNPAAFSGEYRNFDTYYAEQSSVNWGHPGDWWPGQGRNFRLGIEVTI